MVDFTTMNALTRMKPMESMTPMGEDPRKRPTRWTQTRLPSSIYSREWLIMLSNLDAKLGNIDDLAQVQSNITKAGIAVDLLVTVKNEALSAYNTIINMQV